MRLVKSDNPILHQPSLPVVWAPGVWDDFLGDLWRVMVKNNGVGLSAVQVGRLYQVFVMQDQETGKPMYIVNPKLNNHTNKTETDMEGCLSFPDKVRAVERPVRVWVSYTCGITGLKKKERLSGMNARIFLHEYDHLYGITFMEPSAY